MSIEVSRRKVLQLAMAPALLLPRQMQDLAPTASKVYPGSDGKLVYVPDEEAPAAEPADEAFTARITLRLPESLKARLEAHATSAGLSVNTLIVHALMRAGEPRSSTGGGSSSRRRLTGYGRT